MTVGGWAWFRHPRTTVAASLASPRPLRAIAVTLTAVVLTAVPPTQVPASDSPPRIARAWSIVLTRLSMHRLLFALVAAGALLAISVIGYGLTTFGAWLLRPRSRPFAWRPVVTTLLALNALSLLSALIPLPGVLMQIARVPGYIPVDVVLIPVSVVIGGGVVLPIWWTLRLGVGLGPGRAAAVIATATALALALGAIGAELAVTAVAGGD